MSNINKEDLRQPAKSLLGIAGVLLRAFGIYVIGIALTVLFATVILKTDFSDFNSFLNNSLSREKKQTLLQLVQAFQHMAQFIILPFIYIALYNKSLYKIFEIETRKSVTFTFMGIFLFFTALPLLLYISQWNQQIDLPQVFDLLEKKLLAMEETAKVGTMLLIDYNSKTEFLICLFIVAILPGIGEELFFRGVIQNELQAATRNPHLAIWLSAFIFSFFHFQFYGFLPRMFLGAFFGYMYFWSGNILIPMLLHFANNAATLMLMHRFGPQFEKLEKTQVENTSPVLLILSLGITVMLIRYCVRFYKERIAEDES